MATLTEEERITILMMRGWGDRIRSYQEVATLFNESFRQGQDGIVKSTVCKTVQLFQQTRSVKNRPKSGRPRTRSNEENQQEVVQAMIEDPRLSVRKASQYLEMPKSCVHRNLKNLKFHPFKVTGVQELNDDDFDRRLEFCEVMMDRIVQNPNFINNIVFSDEATFCLNGEVNRHNCRYWSDENPHWMIEYHTQYPQKLNVWAGIFRNRIIGPFFIEGNLSGQIYLDLLMENIIPAIQEAAGEDYETVWFQQDGAPPHYRLIVRNYLDETFPERWIGRRGALEWPARSPDLTPLDFFLWGYLKGKVYFTKPHDLNELRERIINTCTDTPEDMIERSLESFYVRLGQCQEVNGAQFEHLR